MNDTNEGGGTVSVKVSVIRPGDKDADGKPLIEITQGTGGPRLAKNKPWAGRRPRRSILRHWRTCVRDIWSTDSPLCVRCCSSQRRPHRSCDRVRSCRRRHAHLQVDQCPCRYMAAAWQEVFASIRGWRSAEEFVRQVPAATSNADDEAALYQSS